MTNVRGGVREPYFVGLRTPPIGCVMLYFKLMIPGMMVLRQRYARWF